MRTQKKMVKLEQSNSKGKIEKRGEQTDRREWKYGVKQDEQFPKNGMTDESVRRS
jgi:hypothetical protein